MKTTCSRRKFLQTTSLASAGFWLAGPRAGFGRPLSPNEKLNLGVIGVAGRGGDDLKEVSGENIVALCDVDDNNLLAAGAKYPQAKTYNDFRKLIDRKDLDAIVIGIPDHSHAVAAVAAIKSGRHVYCEKPLARTVSETRSITDLARKHKRVTQIGTQIHAGNNYRWVVELVQSGDIGTMREVHVWVAAVYGGVDFPRGKQAVPAGVRYHLLLGAGEERPYKAARVPCK